MSIGHEDPKVSYVRTGRASLDQTVTFVEGQLQSHGRASPMTKRGELIQVRGEGGS
jgi:hypothetical protein